MMDSEKKEPSMPISFIIKFRDEMMDKREKFFVDYDYDLFNYYCDIVEAIDELLKRWEKREE